MKRSSRLSVVFLLIELTVVIPVLIFAGFTVGFAISRNTAVGLSLSGVMIFSLLCPALVSGYLWMRLWFFGRLSPWYAKIASLATVGVGLALFYVFCCRPAWVGVFLPASTVVVGIPLLLDYHKRRRRVNSTAELSRLRHRMARCLKRQMFVVLFVGGIVLGAVNDCLAPPRQFTLADVLALAATKTEQAALQPELDSETIAVLSEAAWPDASAAARLAALQAVADYEFASCGMETILLEVEPLDFAILGQYNSEKNTISLARNYFLYDEDPAEVLDTLLHECRHAFQDAVCELFDASGLWESPLVQNGTFFEQEMQWRSSMENYATEDYWTTSIEEDARSYASERAAFYLELVRDAA